MNEQEMRMRRCCFTGHRPEKLCVHENEVKDFLVSAIEQALEDGKRTFISGMARGVDIWAAELVLEYRKYNSEIHLICALPFPGFESCMECIWRSKFESILSKADLIRYICPSFSMNCYQRRNEWMVDHSSRLIAVYNGKNGGTKNTIRYALKTGREIITYTGNE